MNNYESYPPSFRPVHGVGHGGELLKLGPESDPEPPDSYSYSYSDSDSLPVIDFQDMSPENLSTVCREWGMFRLANHGVPAELFGQLHDHANKLFSLSFESKQALLTKPIFYFWGTPAPTMPGNAKQTGPGLQKLNWLEGLCSASTTISRFRYEDPLLESFRSLLEEYGSHQTRLANTLFSTMAEDLRLSPTKSESYLSPPSGILRVYRYLRCPTAEQRWGIHEHTDSSVLSILHQNQVGGLQVYKNNKWLDVKPIHDTLIVNLGDMIQAMSNDSYVSPMHRVRVNREKERISIGYFVFPAEDAVIESSKYKPFTYGDFQAQKELDLKTVGMKIGLPRFKKEQPVCEWLD